MSPEMPSSAPVHTTSTASSFLLQARIYDRIENRPECIAESYSDGELVVGLLHILVGIGTHRILKGQLSSGEFAVREKAVLHCRLFLKSK